MRVSIRKPTMGDRVRFLSAARASRTLHQPWVEAPSSVRTFKGYIERIRRPDHDACLVCLRNSGDLVGVFNFNNVIRGAFQNAFLGFYAFAPHAGKGLMSEGLQLALRYAFSRLRLHRLEANIQPGNLASVALVRRCGFVREGFSRAYLRVSGRWRDHERWALVAHDWKSARVA